MISPSLQQPAIHGQQDFLRCNLSGDGSDEANSIIAAGRAQHRQAIETLDRLVPGLDPLTLSQSSGTSTPRIMNVGDGIVGSAPTLLDLIDLYLWQGDLGELRAALIDPGAGSSQQVGPSVTSHRLGDSSALSGEPHLLCRELRRGQTLVFNDAQQRLGRAVFEMVSSLAIAFRAHTQVNAYLSVGEAPGFGLHWDDHDVLVVQLEGRKYWEVRKPVDIGGLKGITPSRQGGDVAWSGLMEPGRALYIPRGWAHSVSGLADEQSAHLTFGFRRLNALDALGMLNADWFADDWTFDPSQIEHGIGSWRATIATSPRHGPLQELKARAAGFAGWNIGMSLWSGAVFLPERCDDATLAMTGNNRVFSVQRSEAGSFAHLLEGTRMSPEELVMSLGRSGALLPFLDELGSSGLMTLHPEG